MTGLDTNVLVRYLVQDDPFQSPIADKVMESLTIEHPGWISQSVILELVWVLRSGNLFGSKTSARTTIAEVIDRLLSQEEIVVEQADVLRTAIRLYRQGNADFPDCLIAVSAKAAGCSRTVTFDRCAARNAGMELLQ